MAGHRHTPDCAGLHAPDIHAADADLGFVLMADLGNRLYLPELGNEQRRCALRRRACDALLTMQTRVDASDDLPAYDEERLVAEMELMPEWLLQRHLGVIRRNARSGM